MMLLFLVPRQLFLLDDDDDDELALVLQNLELSTGVLKSQIQVIILFEMCGNEVVLVLKRLLSAAR